jgi:hypothetical protein
MDQQQQSLHSPQSLIILLIYKNILIKANKTFYDFLYLNHLSIHLCGVGLLKKIIMMRRREIDFSSKLKQNELKLTLGIKE